MTTHPAWLVVLVCTAALCGPAAGSAVGEPVTVASAAAARQAGGFPDAVSGLPDTTPSRAGSSSAASSGASPAAGSAASPAAGSAGSVPGSAAGSAAGSGGSSDSDSGDADPTGAEGVDGVDALAENRNPGTDKWLISAQPLGTRIEGYAGQVSVLAGEHVDLYVSSTAPAFRVEVLRTGSYDGHLARRIYSGPSVPGGPQSGMAKDPSTRMVSATWQRSTTLATAGWLPGAYLVKLIGADGAQSYVPFDIRDQHSTGAILLVDSTATWQAYNAWGGPSTYRGNQSPTAAQDVDERAYAASYDRPYDREHGAGDFLNSELPAIAAAERLGLRLNYATDVDLELHPEVLDGAVGVALLGHSEYWSRTMRANLTAARDRGVNLAFFGANDVHRRVRLLPSPTGPGRTMINYKLGALDPVQTLGTTADWGKAPYPDPQSALVGPMFKCARAQADLVVTDPDSWLFRGQGLTAGTRLPGMVGPEFDRVMTWVAMPRPIQVLAHSPALCQGKPEFADMTWYSMANGAGVFDAGTLNWIPGMTSPDSLTRRVVTTATERVLKMIGSPLAGRAQPATDNVSTFYAPDGKGLPYGGAPGSAGPPVGSLAASSPVLGAS